MVLSYAGVGRNATLITYRPLAARITDMACLPAITGETIDAALFDVIYAGRGDRDAAYIPSLQQLVALRQALYLLIVEQRTIDVGSQ